MDVINPETNSLALYPFSAEMLQNRIKEVLYSENQEINAIFTYLLKCQGKLFRPRLVSLCASLGNCEALKSRDMAAAIELIHMASLIHDDIIDGAVLRRGQESLNQRWGSHVSVLAGDYLFAAAFQLINLHDMQAVMAEVTRTIKIMCTGEIRQVSLAYNLGISEKDYFQKIYEKTACLFASACKIGAITAGLNEKAINSLEQFGMAMGYAFQMIDDILDFVSDSTLLGKPVGNDLLEGNITLPIIYALADPAYGEWLRMILDRKKITSKQLQRIQRVLYESGAIERSLIHVREFIDTAVVQLEGFPPSAAKRELQEIAQSIINEYFKKMSPALIHQKVVH